MSSATEVGDDPVDHRTPRGRLSMDPAKWRVAQVVTLTRNWQGEIIKKGSAWGIFPPHSDMATLQFPTHRKAIERAQKYGYFNVVPALEDSET